MTWFQNRSNFQRRNTYIIVIKTLADATGERIMELESINRLIGIETVYTRSKPCVPVRLSPIHSNGPSGTRFWPRWVQMYVWFTRVANSVNRVLCVSFRWIEEADMKAVESNLP